MAQLLHVIQLARVASPVQLFIVLYVSLDLHVVDVKVATTSPALQLVHLAQLIAYNAQIQEHVSAAMQLSI